MARAAKTTKSKNENRENVSIILPEIKEAVFEITGTAELIVNRFKNLKDIEAKRTGAGGSGTKKIDPKAEFVGSIYRGPNDEDVIPALWLKKAMVWVAGQKELNFITATRARGAFFAYGPKGEDYCVLLNPNDLKKPVESYMRTDMVRIGRGKNADVRYRAAYPRWSTRVMIRYNATVISLEEITTLLIWAGFMNGLGEWRPEKSGHGFGTFSCGNVRTF